MDLEIKDCDIKKIRQYNSGDEGFKLAGTIFQAFINHITVQLHILLVLIN